MLKLLAIAVVVLSGSAFGQAPQPIQDMNNLPNAAELHLIYCAIGNKVCVDLLAICYGQCGNQSEADDMGYGCSGDLRGYVPYGFHYAKWYAVDYATRRRVSGLATQGSKDCTNHR